MKKTTFGKRNWWILLLFGLMGQIAWSVENMYFNLFVFETISPDLNAVTLMVQLSGVVATMATLLAGTLSDKVGNRRSFMAWGYIIWGVTVALFGTLNVSGTQKILGSDLSTAVTVTLIAVIAGDCVMTLFGSTANDAAFNAWVTDNTEETFRGRVESVVAVLPLAAMLIVAGGFGILVEAIGYQTLFFVLGGVITVCGIVGIFTIKDSPTLERKGTLKDLTYGFKPSVIKANPALYLALCVMCVYGVACQIFMPYLIIYMKTYLGFSVIEYSIVFGVAIVLGGALNIFLGAVSDKIDKVKALYVAASVMATGLLGMSLMRFENHIATLVLFGVAGFVMIAGYIFFSALSGAIVRDYTPEKDAGKLQGVRMIFYVLIPMLVGPLIGNAINQARNIPLPDLGSADTMTTQFIPAPEIFLAGAILTLCTLALIPLLGKATRKKDEKNELSKIR
ncbi:MAG: MFS transporter [Clostridia bacterium]|nr:MFS transporter [Clostridia bacterium]